MHSVQSLLTTSVNSYRLQSESVSFDAKQFQSHPAQVIQIQEFFKKDIAQLSAKFLLEQAKYKPVYGLYSHESCVTNVEKWQAAAEKDRFFFYNMLDGMQDSSKINLASLAFLKLRKILGSSDFREYAESLTQLRLKSTSKIKVHQMQAEHSLSRHNDKGKGRRIAFILYLSPQWRTCQGGNLCIEYKDKSKVRINQLTKLPPTYNSLVLFDVLKHDAHHVSEILTDEELGAVPRISINGWFMGEQS